MPPPVTLNSPIFHCCQTLQTLPLPDKTTAHSLLTRAATHVRPIMAKRRWSVPLLAEFYPPHSNLLGLNHDHGQKIQVRLRSPRSPTLFLPYESILATLLHELAHIQVGPHNQQFYALFDQLKHESNQLTPQQGNPTNTFTGQAHRLTHQLPTTLPKHHARQRALDAAEKRRTTNRIMNRAPSGGRRLGGPTQPIARLSDPREMALAAAERRRLDDHWCGNAQPIEVIDLDGPDSNNVPRQSESLSPRRKVQRTHTVQASHVPVRESAAGLAAMQRAWANGCG